MTVLYFMKGIIRQEPEGNGAWEQIDTEHTTAKRLIDSLWAHDDSVAAREKERRSRAHHSSSH